MTGGSRFNLWPFYSTGIKMLLLNTILGVQQCKGSTGLCNFFLSLFYFISGYYCPAGTTEYDQFPCAPGTYGTSTGLRSADQCSPCPAGYICSYGTTDFAVNGTN